MSATALRSIATKPADDGIVRKMQSAATSDSSGFSILLNALSARTTTTPANDKASSLLAARPAKAPARPTDHAFALPPAHPITAPARTDENHAADDTHASAPDAEAPDVLDSRPAVDAEASEDEAHEAKTDHVDSAPANQTGSQATALPAQASTGPAATSAASPIPAGQTDPAAATTVTGAAPTGQAATTAAQQAPAAASAAPDAFAQTIQATRAAAAAATPASSSPTAPANATNPTGPGASPAADNPSVAAGPVEISVSQASAPGPANPAVSQLTDSPASVLAVQPAGVPAGPAPAAAQPPADTLQATVGPTASPASPVASASVSTSAADAQKQPATGDNSSEIAPTTQAAAPVGVPAEASARAVAPTEDPAREPVTAARVVSQIEKAIQHAPTTRPTEVNLRLNPEHLGRVDIRLASEDTGLAVTVTAHNPHTRAMIDSLLPQLKDSLTEQGIDVRSLTVASGTSSGQADVTDHGWRQDSTGASPRGQAFGWRQRQEDAVTGITSRPRRTTAVGLVDYRA